MISGFPNTVRLVLAKDSDLGRLTVDLQSFLEFDAQMAGSIEELVEDWLPLAAPQSVKLELRADMLDERS